MRIDDFIQAIRERQKVKVQFYSKEDNCNLSRTCAPMDYGPSRRAKEKNDRLHLWDFDSDTGQHMLSLNLEQVLTLEILEEKFDPEDFVTWDTASSPWFVPRDWGNRS